MIKIELMIANAWSPLHRLPERRKRVEIIPSTSLLQVHLLTPCHKTFEAFSDKILAALTSDFRAAHDLDETTLFLSVILAHGIEEQHEKIEKNLRRCATFEFETGNSQLQHIQELQKTARWQFTNPLTERRSIHILDRPAQTSHQLNRKN